MIKLHRTLLAAALLVAAATSSQAAPIVGQIGLTEGPTSGVITATPSDLSAANLVLDTSQLVVITKPLMPSGDFSLIPTGTTVSVPASLNVQSPLPAVLTFSSFGTFVASGFTIVNATTDLFRAVYSGTFTPAGALAAAGFTANSNTLLSLTFQRVTPTSGITFTGSLVAQAVPEPSSFALAGLGMAAAGLFGLRKRLAK